MTWTYTSVHLSMSARLALLLTMAYAVWLIVSLRQIARRQRGGLMLLLLPPLLLAAAGTWIGFANVSRSAGLPGAGQPTIANGVAQAVLGVAFGGIFTAICAGIALFRVARTSYDAIGVYPRPPIAVAALCWAISLGALVMPPFLFSGDFTIWNITLAAAFLSLALLIPLAVVAGLANRNVVPRRAQLIALTTTLVLALIQIGVAWALIHHYFELAVIWG